MFFFSYIQLFGISTASVMNNCFRSIQSNPHDHSQGNALQFLKLLLRVFPETFQRLSSSITTLIRMEPIFFFHKNSIILFDFSESHYFRHFNLVHELERDWLFTIFFCWFWDSVCSDHNCSCLLIISFGICFQ